MPLIGMCCQLLSSNEIGWGILGQRCYLETVQTYRWELASGRKNRQEPLRQHTRQYFGIASMNFLNRVRGRPHRLRTWSILLRV